VEVENQFVVDLEQHAGVQFARAQLAMDVDHGLTQRVNPVGFVSAVNPRKSGVIRLFLG
jgi:hypothetical protein